MESNGVRMNSGGRVMGVCAGTKLICSLRAYVFCGLFHRTVYPYSHRPYCVGSPNVWFICSEFDSMISKVYTIKKQRFCASI